MAAVPHTAGSTRPPAYARDGTRVAPMRRLRIARLILRGWRCRVDPFLKKDWYDIKAPSLFTQRNVGKTLVTRTQGTKVRGPPRSALVLPCASPSSFPICARPRLQSPVASLAVLETKPHDARGAGADRVRWPQGPRVRVLTGGPQPGAQAPSRRDPPCCPDMQGRLRFRHAVCRRA